MSIIRGSNIASNNSAATTTVALPGGCVVGDLAILFAGGTGASGANIPAGWTDIFPSGSFSWSGFSAYKNLTSGDILAGSVTVNIPSAFGSYFDSVVTIVTFIGTYAIREYEGYTGGGTSSTTLTTSSSVYRDRKSVV